mmetsp:Transcript_38429/g.61681  ORF Transcript_38429/g.61681 Transcript_38429/m.61681 type:complete len:202 (-) Transcript_38429:92-697(-)
MDIQGLPQRKKRERSRGRKKKNTESDETKAEKPSSSNLFEDNVKVSESKDSKIDIPPEPEKKYEYLDHIADIKFHSWGKDLKEALEQMVICMFSYMTELDEVEIDDEVLSTVNVKGHDEESMVFSLLDEFLYNFSVEEVVCKRCRVKKIDVKNWSIEAIGFGEKFSLAKHPQGTEIKAITKHDMKIVRKESSIHVYVVVDI